MKNTKLILIGLLDAGYWSCFGLFLGFLTSFFWLVKCLVLF